MRSSSSPSLSSVITRSPTSLSVVRRALVRLALPVAFTSLLAAACGGSTGGVDGDAGGNGGNGGNGSGGTSSGGNGLPGCAGNGCTSQPQCTTPALPATLHITVSGFVSCTCFNGTFALAQEGGAEEWSSAAIAGCAGQSDTAYIKFIDQDSLVGIGITDATSDPGSGNSDYAPASSATCSPLSIAGGGSQAGNINAFCAGGDDENISWTVTE